MKLSKPLNDNAEVLRALIVKGKVDCVAFSWMEGFRTRLSNLRLNHRAKLVSVPKSKKNRHGNTITYKQHSLKPGTLDYHIGLYLKINKRA